MQEVVRRQMSASVCLFKYSGAINADNYVRLVEENVNDYVTVRVYTPVDRTGILPVGIYFHGGGFCCGDLDSEDSFCRTLAERHCCVVVSVGYRLAPEHKSPAQTEDAIAA